MEQGLTPEQRIAIAREILSSDCAAEADELELDIKNGYTATLKEKHLAGVINKLYKLLHPSERCPHPDWEAEYKVTCLDMRCPERTGGECKMKNL